jgi:hypothetical protein
MDSVKDDVLKFFNNEEENIPEELDLVKETSLTIGQAFM